MAVLILFFGFYIIYPVTLIFIQSFNIAGIIEGTYEFSLNNWREAFAEPDVLESLTNTIFVFAAYTTISFPTAVLISWLLARTPIAPHPLMSAFMIRTPLPPSISNTLP